MNVNGSHNNKPKQTKRERKQYHFGLDKSLQGFIRSIGDKAYIGDYPEYTKVEDSKGRKFYIKTKAGLPFVAITHNKDAA